MHMLPAFLMMFLVHAHLTMLEPVIKDAVIVAKNPVVRKDVKTAFKAVEAIHKARQSRKKTNP